MQFRYSLFFVVLLFSLCLGSLFFYLGTYNSEDKAAYHQLLQGEETEDVAGFSSKQHRTKMQKDLFFNEKGKRLQMHLESENADLVLNFHPQQEIVEQMQGVVCYVQEDLFDVISKEEPSVVKPMQQMLYFESPSAVYYYSNRIFVAENVKIFRYVVPGHGLYNPHLDSGSYSHLNSENDSHMISRGEAKSIEFSLEENHFNFKANGLRTILYESKSIR